MAAEPKMTVKSLKSSPENRGMPQLERGDAPDIGSKDGETESQSVATTSNGKPEQPSLKGVVVYLDPVEAIALKVYAAQHSTSIQQLGTEAFAELFRKHGINGGTLTRVRANRKHGANR